MDVHFSQEALKEINRIIAQYPKERKNSALLPVLHVVQKETEGWLSPETMDKVASILEIKPIEVYEVVTFYTMYFTKPVGKYVIEVCQTGPCMICGSDHIIKYLEDKLGIKVGETTPDNIFTLRAVECLGACGYAPMLQIGEQYYEHLTEEKLDQIIHELGSKHSDKY
ncbi:MAG: NADH-quinone oxidoreductase subunit NuoE [Chitinophagales bacterium]|nr:NADH-quinone oxidoreductase subunit NuoE [Chitinophagales bacterium]